MKIILVLLDGLGDRSYAVLDDRTPLQAAHTPNLDRLASLGSNGLFHASLVGECLPSEIAHYILFGYDRKNFPGRGLFEAVGEGLVFDDEDVLSLAHLACVTWEEEIPILAEKRPVMDTEELEALFEAIRSFQAHGIHFRLEQTRRNDGILVLSGEASPYVSDSDPMTVGRPMAKIQPIENNLEPDLAGHTAKALNQYLTHCHNVLTDHDVNRRRLDQGLSPANFLATQRCGRRIEQEPFDQKWGMAGALIASGSVYGGLAREIGLTFVRTNDTEEPDADLRERINTALSDDSHDFVHVHTKVPDEAAHTGKPENKEAAISALDRGLDELLEAVEKRDDLLVVVTADHSTPSISTLIHSGEPVPFTIVGPTVRRDDVKVFDEVSAATGCMGLLRGRELMLMILNYADRSAMAGHNLQERPRPYFPKQYQPFKLVG
ncbi:MAG: 2,3-bisphosphoglycerate-independent phosphoglycerate mutase [Deltaproteobacteria bacterium]|nr:2,3-bisphosphoglycerate-independent phosphoglycerate mutase [Deltaproteobacteria bacterium]